jgi:general stress protein YciG
MGTQQGGHKTAEKNRKKDPAFYARIGAMGGRKSRGGGFSNRDLASRAGKIGGKLSRRPGSLALA